MRATTRALIDHCVEHLDLSGQVPADDVTAELMALHREVAAMRRATAVPMPVRAAAQLAGAARRGVRRGVSRVR